MEKRSYTITTSTGPLGALDDHLLELIAASLTKSRVMMGTVVSGDALNRTMSVRGSVEVAGVVDAVLAAGVELGKAFSRAGLRGVEIVDLAVMKDLDEDEFASARDDVVGTPDVAARLGISRQRVAQLVEQQGRFPTPIATVRGTHVWRWGDIADWLAAGGRKTPGRPKHVDTTIDLMAALHASVGRAQTRASVGAKATREIHRSDSKKKPRVRHARSA